MGIYKVVGYRDMRPIDWVSGKRMPLDPGEGHLCDRCGAEHAVVYTVENTETRDRYEVGSSCAKKQFGFEVDKTQEAKLLIRDIKARAAEDLDQARQKVAEEMASEILDKVSSMPVPSPESNPHRYPNAILWVVGDGQALEAHGRNAAETIKVATRTFFEKRIAELIPSEYSKISLRIYPNTRDKTTITMSRKVEHLVLMKIKGIW